MIDTEKYTSSAKLLTEATQLSADTVATVDITEPGFKEEVLSDTTVVDQSGELRQLRPTYELDIVRTKSILTAAMALSFMLITLNTNEFALKQSEASLAMLALLLPTLFFWFQQAERQYKHRRSVSLLYQKLAARQRVERLEVHGNVTITDPTLVLPNPEDDHQQLDLTFEVWTQSLSLLRDLIFNYSLAVTVLYWLRVENKTPPDFLGMISLVILIEIVRSSLHATHRHFRLRRWQKLVSTQQQLDAKRAQQASIHLAEYEDDDDFDWEKDEASVVRADEAIGNGSNINTADDAEGDAGASDLAEHRQTLASLLARPR